MGVRSELPEYMRRLARMPNDVFNEVEDGYEKVIPRMASTVRGNAPVRTGELRASIGSEVHVVDEWSVEGTVFSTSEYAPIHERGGWHPVWDESGPPYYPIAYQNARHYFIDGVRAHLPEMQDVHTDAVVTAARRAGFK